MLLLDKLPDDSEFKRVSERNGRRSRSQEVAEDTHNELAWLRASFYAVHGGEKAVYEPSIYRDPIDEAILAEREAADAAMAERGVADFNAQIGYSQQKVVNASAAQAQD